MTARFVLAAACALLPGPMFAGQPAEVPGKNVRCPPRPVECQVNAPVFNFGRHDVSGTSSPIFSNATISVTCMRNGGGYTADVSLELKGLPHQRSRRMHARNGADLTYDLFVDAARTRLWGDGTAGTSTFRADLRLNERNRIETVVFLLYGTVDGRQTVEPAPLLGAVLGRVDYSVDCR